MRTGDLRYGALDGTHSKRIRRWATRWTSPGTDEKGKGYLNRTSLMPGESRKWEDWEFPCCVTSFLAIVIHGVGLNTKSDPTIETWALEKALERLREKEMATAGESE